MQISKEQLLLHHFQLQILGYFHLVSPSNFSSVIFLNSLIFNSLIQIKILIILSISLNEILIPLLVLFSYLIIKLFFKIKSKRQIQ